MRTKRATTPIGGGRTPENAPHVLKPRRAIAMFTPTAWARTGVARGWLEATGWTLGLERATRGRAEIPVPGANNGTVPGLYMLTLRGGFARPRGAR